MARASSEVGAGAAEADNDELLQREQVVEFGDAGPAGGRLDVRNTPSFWSVLTGLRSGFSDD
ncbi:MAG: hypothetical protein ACRCYU_20235 [Nocardioides sp.]